MYNLQPNSNIDLCMEKGTQIIYLIHNAAYKYDIAWQNHSTGAGWFDGTKHIILVHGQSGEQ